MIRANSIREWVREHTLQDTLQIMENGEAVYFVREKKSLTDATATMYDDMNNCVAESYYDLTDNLTLNS